MLNSISSAAEYFKNFTTNLMMILEIKNQNEVETFIREIDRIIDLNATNADEAKTAADILFNAYVTFSDTESFQTLVEFSKCAFLKNCNVLLKIIISHAYS